MLHCEGVCVSPAGRRRTAWHGCRRAHGPVRRGDPPARSPIYTRASTRRTTPRAQHPLETRSPGRAAPPVLRGGASGQVRRRRRRRAARLRDSDDSLSTIIHPFSPTGRDEIFLIYRQVGRIHHPSHSQSGSARRRGAARRHGGRLGRRPRRPGFRIWKSSSCTRNLKLPVCSHGYLFAAPCPSAASGQ